MVSLNIFRKSVHKRYFLITSHGQTATLWLAAVLNSHPSIFCSHAYSYPPIGAEPRELTIQEDLQRQKDASQRFWNLSLSDFFSELEHHSCKDIIGNVHGFTYGYLAPKLDQLPKQIKQHLEILNLLRHPVSRLMSMVRNWIKEEEQHQVVDFVAHDFTHRCTHILDFLIQRHQNIDLEHAQHKTFIVGLLAIEDITRDAMLAKKHCIPNLQFEQITSDTTCLLNILKRISGGSLSKKDRNLANIINIQQINQHNSRTKTSVQNQYEQWQPWQKHAFQFIMTRNDVGRFYINEGYDLSFLHA
jgi:hypothetical protein